jgi:hypothetical protein
MLVSVRWGFRSEETEGIRALRAAHSFPLPQAAEVRKATSVRIVSSKSELQDADVLPVLGLLGSKFKLTQDGNKTALLVELMDDQNTPMGHNIVSSMPGMDHSQVHIRVNDSLLSGMISQVGPT